MVFNIEANSIRIKHKISKGNIILLKSINKSQRSNYWINIKNFEYSFYIFENKYYNKYILLYKK